MAPWMGSTSWRDQSRRKSGLLTDSSPTSSVSFGVVDVRAGEGTQGRSGGGLAALDVVVELAGRRVEEDGMDEVGAGHEQRKHRRSELVGGEHVHEPAGDVRGHMV
jgi:hypothetical protein